MGPPEADRFAELRPFYQLCALGLLLAVVNGVFALWTVGGSWGAAAGSVGISAGWMAWRHGRRRELEQRLAQASTNERPRLKARLDALRARLRRFSGDEAAQLVLVPDPAVVLATVRSRQDPLVEMTAGFWTTYADEPDIVDAALAHEAGHVVARDVEPFQRMLEMMRGVLYVFPLLNLLYLLFLVTVSLLARVTNGEAAPGPEEGLFAEGLGREVLIWLYFTLQFALLPALAVAVAWSALLLARELQADAFAVELLGSEHPVRALLQHQLQRRQQQKHQRSPLRRLGTWLIQPDLRWRSTLPAMQGRLGFRVELMLGWASGGFLLSAVSAAFFVELRRGGHGVLIVLLIPLVMGWLAWISYAFFWGRSRVEAGRGVRGFLSEMGSVLRFAGAQVLVISLWMHLPFAGPLGMKDVWEDVEWRVLSYLWAFTLVVWAAGKLALCSEAEWRRARPSGVRALGSLLAMGALSWAVSQALEPLWGAAGLLSARKTDTASLTITSLLVAGLLGGVLGYLRVRPPPRSIPPVDPGPG